MEIRNFGGTETDVSCRSVVIKLGSNVVLCPDFHADRPVIERLADAVVAMRAKGIDVTVVSSGAIGMACNQMKRPRPSAVWEKQAYAAIGQISLMHVYQEVFARKGLIAAQVLLTRGDMDDPKRYQNVKNALGHLHSLGAIPIINENDTTSVEELSFGDNDMLSVKVAVSMKADLLIILSTVDGVLASPPGDSGEAPMTIPCLDRVDDEALARVDDSRSGHGSGGMKSKLAAVRIASENGVHVVIAGGKKPGVIEGILAGESRGTYIRAAAGALAADQI